MSVNEDFLHRDFIHGDPRLEVARQIAREAHLGQFRDTGGAYIEHPELACNLLDALGASDVQKAVALLHDVLEDGPRYKDREGEEPGKNYLLLKDDLLKKLKARCNPTAKDEEELTRWADRVYEGVKQLTLGSYTFEGKRTTQIDAVKYIDPEFRPVKIMDQASTVVYDLMYSNPANEQQITRDRNFALKGLDLSRACFRSDPANPYHDLYKRVFNRFRSYYKSAQKQHREEEGNRNFQMAESIRGSFDLKQAVADALNPAISEEVKPERVDPYTSPRLKTRNWLSLSGSQPALTQGLANINLSRKTGRVVSFGLIVTDDESPANDIAANLRAALEKSMRRTVETGEKVKAKGVGKYHDTLQVRDYKFSHPMGLDSFLRRAKDNDAIDEGFMRELSRRITPGSNPRIKGSTDTARGR